MKKIVVTLFLLLVSNLAVASTSTVYYPMPTGECYLKEVDAVYNAARRFNWTADKNASVEVDFESSQKGVAVLVHVQESGFFGDSTHYIIVIPFVRSVSYFSRYYSGSNPPSSFLRSLPPRETYYNHC